MVGLKDVVETMWGRPLPPAAELRLRRRLVAFAGLGLFLAGLAAALGFGALVLDAAIVLLTLGAAVVVALGVRRVPARTWLRQAFGRIGPTRTAVQPQIGEFGVPGRLHDLTHHAGRSSRRATVSLGTGGARARRAGVAAGKDVLRGAELGLRLGSRLSAHAVVGIGSSARTRLAERAKTPSRLPTRTPAPPVRRRHDQAMRLNTLGAQLRREGEHERAAEQHRAALAIVRDLGDEHNEALTLNNLALAVVHTDGIAAAVEHFEQALVVLRALGDEEHEGRVIANLGFIHKSHGRSEEAEPLLHAALDKLPADSTAYRRVEEQLRRAS
ncbi:MAG: tetratricopeptide repeat protein [Actinobacteria bacterium]|nr:tetratricopeptide repeat protein [Actinomycetota bacterium]